MLLKTFFSGTFIEKKKLEEVGINHPIKLEYYKEINEDDIKEKAKFGILIVKTDYMKDNKIKVEKKEIKYITNDEIEENRILNIFSKNQVTPINSEEVISDLLIGKWGRPFFPY